MPEIRQIRVGGVTYDVVASEDEVSASRAQQYATQAQNSATLANNYKDTAGLYATTAKNYREECLVQVVNANDAADRAEAIVGGQFVSYGQDQGLSDAYKLQARKNIGVTLNNPNLLDNAWFRVNEANFTSSNLTNGQRIVNRWFCETDNTDCSISYMDGSTLPYLYVDARYATGYISVCQKLSQHCVYRILGEVVTVSVMINGMVVVSGTVTRRYQSEQIVKVFAKDTDDNPLARIRFTATDCVAVDIYGGYSRDIYAVKLELGEVSTLKYDSPESYGVDLTGSVFSKADPNDPYANTGFGRSNRNLLDNPFFQVNQRNYTNNSANDDYVADRWFLYGAPTLTVTNSGNGIVLTGSGDARLRHHIDEKLFMTSYGQPLTFSIKVNGQVYSHTFNNVSSYPSAQTGLFDTTIRTSAGNVNIAAAWQNANHVVLVYFRAYAPMTIQAVKLELGSYSTLANDVPPDYGEELLKCARYFLRIGSTIYFPYGSGIAHNATNIRVLIPTPVQMRTDPSVSFTGTLTARGNGASLSVSALAAAYVQKNGVALSATTTGATTYQSYSLVPTTSGYIDLSADL